jgi:hypothetical protein
MSIRVASVVVLVAVACAVCACQPQGVAPSTSSTPAAGTAPATGTAPAADSSVASASVAPQPGPPAATGTGATGAIHPSAASLEYAKQLGGASHEGEKLYFLIGDSVATEAKAQALLDDATPNFGDMQSYFIVQRSDNFEGMRPGYWIVAEAYRGSPSSENLQFGRRGFPDAYVKKAVVRTSDPIPVYEDLVPN